MDTYVIITTERALTAIDLEIRELESLLAHADSEFERHHNDDETPDEQREPELDRWQDRVEDCESRLAVLGDTAVLLRAVVLAPRDRCGAPVQSAIPDCAGEHAVIRDFVTEAAAPVPTDLYSLCLAIETATERRP